MEIHFKNGTEKVSFWELMEMTRGMDLAGIGEQQG